MHRVAAAPDAEPAGKERRSRKKKLIGNLHRLLNTTQRDWARCGALVRAFNRDLGARLQVHVGASG